MKKICLLLLIIPFLIGKTSAQTNPNPILFDPQISLHIFPYIFTHELTPNQVHPPISNISEFKKRISQFDLGTADLFKVTKTAKVLNTETISDSIFNLTFQYNQKVYGSYSFFIPGEVSEDSVAFLIIPGSNDNQSTEIYNNSSLGYHKDIASKASKYGDTYIYIKPNQDILALYNNGRKLSETGFIPYLINYNFSYPAYYLSQCAVLASHLKKKYKKVVIIGCSQGGYGSLLVSLITKPKGSVVSSGFSILFQDIFWAGLDQVISSDISNLISNDVIYDSIINSPTKYFFSYGNQEIAYYYLEATKGYTKSFFEPLKNVTFYSGNFGHTFPQPATEKFIREVIRPDVKLMVTDSTICENDSVMLSAMVDKYEYLVWYKDSISIDSVNTEIFVKEPGNYFFKAYSYSGIPSSSQLYTLKLSPSPNPVISYDKKFLKVDNGVKFQWLLNGEAILGADSSEHYPLFPGNYSCVVWNTQNCSHHSQVIKLSAEQLPVFVVAYESAYNEKLNIVLNNNYIGNLNIEIYNSLGQLFSIHYDQKRDINYTNILNIAHLKNGVYLLKIENKLKQIYSVKFIKN